MILSHYSGNKANFKKLTESDPRYGVIQQYSVTLPELKAIKMILGVFGPWQVIAILVVALLLFGGKKIPELMKGLGKGVKEFKDASKPEEATAESADSEDKK